MGYTTKFTGVIKLSRPLTLAEASDWLDLTDDDADIPTPNPGGYMQWVPTEDLDGIVWDGGEKFYSYTEWMQWLCKWLKDRRIDANGELRYSGEEANDTGTLKVSGNLVTVHKGTAGTGHGKPLTRDRLGRLAIQRAR